MFVGDTSTVDTSQREILGKRAWDRAGNEFIYLTGTVSTAAGNWVTYNDGYLTERLVANAVGPVAIAMAATTADRFGWYQIYGVSTTASTDTIAKNKSLYIDGTAGRVDDLGVAGDLVIGAMSLTADASNVATVAINYPHVSDDLGSGGSATPGGVDTNIQFNDSGAFSGDADFTVNKSTGTAMFTGLMVGTQNLIPLGTDNSSLGTTDYRWSDLFLASGAVVNFAGGDVTVTHSANTLAFAGATSGYTFDEAVTLDANDSAALGSATVSWSDLFLASGAVINFANGNVTLTHDTSKLTLGSNGLLDIAAGVVELNDRLRFDTGTAVVAASYAVHRDLDGTNQLHLNVPTGATFEFSVNDTPEALLSATNFTPGANDGNVLGSATVSWSDLFLALGAVINFNDGDVTLTHAANTLTMAGGDLAVDNISAGSWSAGRIGVGFGGTGTTSYTAAYAVLCAGTATTGALQSIAGVGDSGQVLTSNGAGALPTFQAAAGGSPSTFTYVLTPENAQLPNADFPAYIKSTSTNITYFSLDFDQTTPETCYWQLPIPAYMDAVSVGTITTMWTTVNGSSAQIVRWVYELRPVANDEVIGATTTPGTTSQIYGDSWIANNDLHTFVGSMTTPSGIAGSDMLEVKLYRDVVNDDLLNDAKFLKGLIELREA